MNYKKLFPTDFVESKVLVLLAQMSARLSSEFNRKSEEAVGFLILRVLQQLDMVTLRKGGDERNAWILTTEGEAALQHFVSDDDNNEDNDNDDNDNDDNDDNDNDDNDNDDVTRIAA
jgi:hypothetical protein